MSAINVLCRPALPLLFCLGLAAAASGQTGSVTYYGQNCGMPAPYGSPLIHAWIPRINRPIEFTLLEMRMVRDNLACVHGGMAFLVIGQSRTQWNGVGLPALLPTSLTAGFPCLALVSLDAILWSGIGLGGAGFSTTIPNDPSLVGARLYAQWYALYWTTLNLSCTYSFYKHWVTSNAVELVIGV